MTQPTDDQDINDRYYYDTATGTIKPKPAVPTGQPVIRPPEPVDAAEPAPDPSSNLPSPLAPSAGPLSADAVSTPDVTPGSAGGSEPSLSNRVDFLYRRLGITYPDQADQAEPGGNATFA